MLVLSRRASERIRLGDSIVVTVVQVAGDRVRLGIEAPADIRVLRDELEPRRCRGRSAAAGVNKSLASARAAHVWLLRARVPRPAVEPHT